MYNATIILCLVSFTLNSCPMGNPDKIDALFSAYSDDNPGASVMVIHKGKVILNNNYGLANIAQHIPVTEMSNFRLASITKQFTAMAILQLMDEKLLDFNTKMIEIFPEFPDYANAIDYGQLLHHTSGLVDYEELMADTLSVPLLDADVLHLLLTQDSTYFEPGSNYSYSNGGYAILALTVERLAGLSFPEYLEKHIFIPLGMHASLAYKRADPDFSNRAFGYYVNQGDVLLSDQSMTSSVLGDGGVYSSTSDMYKWDQALYGTSLLSQALMDSAFTPWKEDYGCGWRIEDYRGLKRISHTGSTSGFRNVFQRFPEQEFSVIILTNRRDPGVQYLAEAITDIYLLD